MVFPLPRGVRPLLDLLPVCLGGSHGVVAVTDCVGEERLCVRAAVLRVEGLAVAQRLQTASIASVSLPCGMNQPVMWPPFCMRSVSCSLEKEPVFFEQWLDDPAGRGRR